MLLCVAHIFYAILKCMKALLTERRRLLAELKALKLVIRGSYFERFSVCARKECRCHAGKKHGPRGYVTTTVDAVQRQFYIPQSQLGAVKKGVQQYHRVLEILDRVSRINLELMRGQNLESEASGSSE